jgi:hypothetical protein
LNDGKDASKLLAIGEAQRHDGDTQRFRQRFPKAELVVIILQQVMPFDFSLQIALKPTIYSAIQD